MSFERYNDLLVYANLSKMIYFDEIRFKIELIKSHLSVSFLSWIENKETNTQCAFIKYNNKLILVFRGTTPISSDIKEFFNDIETNINFKLKNSKFKNENYKVHSGFLKCYLSIKDQIVQFLGLTKELIIIGHSLGGALGHVAALNLKNEEKLNNNLFIRCYTFASPKVGDENFVKLSDKNYRSLNVINVQDPIPCLPQNIFGYCNLGHELLLGKNNCYIKSLKVHAIVKYIELINNTIIQSNLHRNLKYQKFRFKILSKIKCIIRKIF
jgi:hypothetical protein